MKNKKFLILLFSTLIFYSKLVVAEDLAIEAKNVTFDKKEQKTIFQDSVIFKTKENKPLKAIMQNMIKNGFITKNMSFESIKIKKLQLTMLT